jgi:hypothetical protein
MNDVGPNGSEKQCICHTDTKARQSWPQRPVNTIRGPRCLSSLSLKVALVRAALPLQSMLCGGFSTRRYSTLRSRANDPLPLPTPIAATVSETTKSHHACSAERTDQVTYSGDQGHVGVSNHGKRSHNGSPFCGGTSPPNAQNLKRGDAAAFWGERPLGRVAASRFGFTPESN